MDHWGHWALKSRPPGCDPSPETWVRFHQHLMRTFYIPRSQKSKKNTVYQSVFFAFLESARVKATCKTLVKLTPVHDAGEDVGQRAFGFFGFGNADPFLSNQK